MKRIAALVLVILAAAFFGAFVSGGCARERGPEGDPGQTDATGFSTEPADETAAEHATEEPETTPEATAAVSPHPVLVVEAGGKVFYATPEDNGPAHEFAERLSIAPITVQAHDYGGFEKVGDLPWNLPPVDTRITAKPGDVILYEGNKICLYYGENTYEFTRLASIGNVTGEELLAALGDGDVSVRYYVEWSE